MIDFKEMFDVKLKELQGLESTQLKLKVLELEQLVYAHCKGYDLKINLQRLQAFHQPTQVKKFTFKKCIRQTPAQVEQVPVKVEQAPVKVEQTWTVKQVISCTLENVNLKYLKKCIVQSDTIHSSLFIQHAQKSIIVLRLKESALVQNLQNCIVYCSAKQVRIANCTDCIFYVHSKTGPIIEESTKIKFGEWPIEEGDNCWNQVDDFDWLRPEKSPNWEICEKRTVEEVLQVGVDNILDLF